MLITSNIEENSHIPGFGLTFKRDRKSLGLKAELNYRRRNKREYISLNQLKRDTRDDIYITNMQTLESFKETDKGYEFSIIIETDVLWIYRLFNYLYTLISYPIFSIEYSLILNRYDYSIEYQAILKAIQRDMFIPCLFRSTFFAASQSLSS